MLKGSVFITVQWRHLCCVLELALTGDTMCSHRSDAQWMFLNHADPGLMNIPPAAGPLGSQP
jgi:hypothetical protein